MPGFLPHHLGFAGQLAGAAVGVGAIFLLTARSRPPWWGSLLLGLGCAVLALAGFRLSDPPQAFWDFRIAYYPAGHAVLHDPARLHALLAKGVDGFVNIPVAAWAFAPFGAFPQRPAAILFTLLGVALSAAAWALLCRLARLGLRERWLLALLFAANGPLLYSLREGNTSHMVLFALAAGLAFLRGGRNGVAGALLAIATVLKPPLILFAPFFAFRRDLRGLIAYAATGAAVALASLALFGWSENLRWFELCVVAFSRQWLAAFNVQSIPAFLLRLGAGAGHLHDWKALPAIGPQDRLLGQALMFVLLAVGGAACLQTRSAARRRSAADSSERRDLQYMLVVCLALVASPLSWSHYYVWLLAPVAFFLGGRAFGDGPATRGLGWLAIALITPLIWPLSFTNPATQAAYASFGVSHLLFGGLLMFALVAARLAVTGGLLAPFGALRSASTNGEAPNDVAHAPEGGTVSS